MYIKFLIDGKETPINNNTEIDLDNFIKLFKKFQVKGTFYDQKDEYCISKSVSKNAMIIFMVVFNLIIIGFLSYLVYTFKIKYNGNLLEF